MLIKIFIYKRVSSPGQELVNLTLQADHFTALENHLSYYIKFFHRYTVDSFLLWALIGGEGYEQFEGFHILLRSLTGELLERYQVHMLCICISVRMITKFLYA
jgi:hypothetical protein